MVKQTSGRKQISLVSGKLRDHSEVNENLKRQIREFQQSNEYAELSGIDGEPIEF